MTLIIKGFLKLHADYANS